jgi:hypothetical protein
MSKWKNAQNLGFFCINKYKTWNSFLFFPLKKIKKKLIFRKSPEKKVFRKKLFSRKNQICRKSHFGLLWNGAVGCAHDLESEREMQVKGSNPRALIIFFWKKCFKKNYARAGLWTFNSRLRTQPIAPFCHRLKCFSCKLICCGRHSAIG